MRARRRTIPVLAAAVALLASAALVAWPWVAPGTAGGGVRTVASTVAGLALASVAVVGLLRARGRRTWRPGGPRARFDPLTGVLNRGAFQAEAARALVDAGERGDLLALVAVDLDRFELVNATYGDELGDAVLARVAVLLRDSVRDGDLVGRLGGDVFGVGLAGLRDLESAEAVAHKLLGIFDARIEVDGFRIELGASLGVAVGPVDARDVHGLLANAESAVRKVKESGRAGVAFASAERGVRNDRRLEIERRLRVALREDRFEVRYLPTFDLDGGGPVGAELLLRWRDDELGLVTPGEFVPMAESSGLILPLGRWVLRRACAQLAAWRAQGLAVRVSVNVSALQFHQRDFADTVEDVLRQARIDPDRLELEITESVLMRDYAAAQRTLRRLAELGVSVVLDDFGTGISSLPFLQELPIRAIKIDRTFVAGLELRGPGPAGGSAPTVRAMVGLGREFGFEVIAEGIETREQRDFLRGIGCRAGQGFLLCRPQPEEEATALLRAAAGPPEPRMAFAPDGLLTQAG